MGGGGLDHDLDLLLVRYLTGLLDRNLDLDLDRVRDLVRVRNLLGFEIERVLDRVRDLNLDLDRERLLVLRRRGGGLLEYFSLDRDLVRVLDLVLVLVLDRVRLLKGGVLDRNRERLRLLFLERDLLGESDLDLE